MWSKQSCVASRSAQASSQCRVHRFVWCLFLKLVVSRHLPYHFLLQLEPLVGAFLVLFGTALKTGKL